RSELLGFGRETWDVPADKLDALFQAQAPGEPQPENGKGVPSLGATQGTDLLLPLARALEKTGPDTGKILGVVLLTDGQHNVGPSPIAKAIELGEKDLPVFGV